MQHMKFRPIQLGLRTKYLEFSTVARSCQVRKQPEVELASGRITGQHAFNQFCKEKGISKGSSLLPTPLNKMALQSE